MKKKGAVSKVYYYPKKASLTFRACAAGGRFHSRAQERHRLPADHRVSFAAGSASASARG
ncbi:hypothetical protein J2S78_002701 [Salibacterium salarium]|nr:hypothetical protein [Salibacterium salarium]